MKTFTKQPFLFTVFAILALLFVAPHTPPALAQQPSAAVANSVRLVIEGKVMKVHDGDTVTLLDEGNKKTSIRLQGIDAPELKQAFGSASQQNLSRMVLGKQVTIYWTKVDKYRRTVGTIMLDGRDVNIEQVKAGLAWHFKKYEDEQPPEDRRTYSAAEQEAQASKLGLWGDSKSIAPGDWRQAVKAKRWGPPPPEGTIIGNLKSKKYHRPDCAGYRDMAEANRVFFKTVEDAETAGYKRAGNCQAQVQGVAAKPKAVPVLSVFSVTAEPTAMPVVAKGEPLSQQQAIIGNKNSKVYHLPGCAGYTRVSEQNQVKFGSAEEAEKAGYKLAGNCNATKVSADSSPATASVPVSSIPISSIPVSSAPATPDSTPASDEPIIGNKNSKVYHLAGCAGYTRVSEQNQVKFNSAEEAEKAGYKLAGNCTARKVPAAVDSTTPASAASVKSIPIRSIPVSSATATTDSTAATSEPIIGNKNSKIYHLPGCAGYTKVSEKNQVKFGTAEEAETAGFTLAKNCSANK